MAIQFESTPNTAALHRGKVYAVENVYHEDGTASYGINEYDLRKGASQEPKTLYVGALHNGAIQDLLCYGENLYFHEVGMQETAGGGNVLTDQQMRCHVKTGETSRLSASDDATFPGSLAFLKNRMYSCFFTVDMEVGNVVDTKVYQSDLEGGNRERVFEQNDPYVVYHGDEDYLYGDYFKSPWARPLEEQELAVYNESGDKLAAVGLDIFPEDDYYSACLIGAGRDHVFYLAPTEDMFRIYYADKGTIPEGKLEFRLFFEIEIEKMEAPFTKGS